MPRPLLERILNQMLPNHSLLELVGGANVIPILYDQVKAALPGYHVPDRMLDTDEDYIRGVSG
ncbi:hypothetical protein L195_g055955 [Trifolium pratense]|uniref:Uncharacterized protein n=1 Tax=Trifolium pratense TaxID=57577 RepID=A0A2K3KP24_TRIPR|nr:hypothetical protein L195_g055955 [Trifolium pratense]